MLDQKLWKITIKNISKSPPCLCAFFISPTESLMPSNGCRYISLDRCLELMRPTSVTGAFSFKCHWHVKSRWNGKHLRKSRTLESIGVWVLSHWKRRTYTNPPVLALLPKTLPNGLICSLSSMWGACWANQQGQWRGGGKWRNFIGSEEGYTLNGRFTVCLDRYVELI